MSIPSVSDCIAEIRIDYTKVQQYIIAHARMKHACGKIDDRDLRGVVADPFASISREHLAPFVCNSLLEFYDLLVCHRTCTVSVWVIVDEEHFKGSCRSAVASVLRNEESLGDGPMHPENLLSFAQRRLLRTEHWCDLNERAWEVLQNFCYAQCPQLQD